MDFGQGAANVLLEGVFHSMTTNKAWDIEHRWYGSEDVVDHWAHHLVAAPSASGNGPSMGQTVSSAIAMPDPGI